MTNIDDDVPVSEPVTDLKIISNVQEFKWNFAEVKQKIQSDIEKYVGLVVTDENLKEMETAQKEIASIRTKVDGFRKAVKKKIEEPYKVFEGEIKELLQLIEKAEKPLKDQTLKYESDRIIAKEAELKTFAQKTATNMGVRPEYFNIVIPSQWTNRTAKDSAVRKKVVISIETMLDAQRRDDEAREMAKQRIGLIEGQRLAHSALLKTPVVPGDVNHLLVGVALAEIPGIILAECQKRADVEAKASADAIKVELPPTISPQPDYIPDIDPCPEWVGSEIYLPDPVLQLPPIPPLPPAPRSMPPMPPSQQIQPQLFKCVIEYPNITVQEATAIKEFLSSRAIGYRIISQEQVRSAF